MDSFKIDFLDHVAIRVKDLEKSATWYETVLGLKKYQFKEWGAFPIFMLSGKTGVALFPEQRLASDGNIHRMDHFAFNVSRENFEKAKRKFDQLGINYNFQDHHFFHSIYIKDPDEHVVELTTINTDEKAFYSPKSF